MGLCWNRQSDSAQEQNLWGEVHQPMHDRYVSSKELNKFEPLFKIKRIESGYNDVFLLNHARLQVSFYPCCYLTSHSLLMGYNTFNSWEPHEEREKRVIKITCAGSLVPPSRHPFSCFLHSNPQKSFIITSITLENSYLISAAHWTKSTLCAIIMTDKLSWSLLPFCGHCY